MDNTYIICAILIVAVVTFLLRALPFIAGRWLENNLFVDYIKDRFPMVMMFILILYAGNIAKMNTAQEFMPVFLATLVTIIMHFLVRNFFFSIFIGVITYITLLHFNYTFSF